jgi:DNA-binding NarL/FixJ family response regulator
LNIVARTSGLAEADHKQNSDRTLSLARRRKLPVFFIVDREANPIMARLDLSSTDAGGDESSYDDRARTAAHRIIVEIAQTGADGGVALLSSSLVLRLAALSGSAGPAYAVFLERLEPRNILADAASRYGLSSREIDVLSLIFQGLTSSQIALQLFIAPTTVHAHVKNIARKTHSSKRTAILATILGLR